LDEAPSGTREDYRGALKEINGDCPFTQPLQVAEVERRLAGRGYDSRVVRVES
jgi:hypothetical protein